jgi:hypothetical protein
MTGVEKHENTLEYRIWRRQIFHACINYAMKPLEKVMKSGIEIQCGDGRTRLIYPILCQYIGDMEEQWLLTCLRRPFCPKCYNLSGGHNGEGMEIAWSKSGESTILPPDTVRTDEQARIHRQQPTRQSERSGSGELQLEDEPEDDALIRSSLGYHPDGPFSENYPYGGILDAVGPDLLHQVSKCFMDYVFEKWIWKLMKLDTQVSEKDLKAEFDARFSLVPSYTGGKTFHNGIHTETHFWSVHEVKEIMKSFVGVIIGICPSEGIHLVREYLHIYRLSHYLCHTENTLEWLESAIETFFALLTGPDSIFIANEIVPANYEPQKLHYLRHYSAAVRAKGALPHYSTDRTEIWHKPLHSAWKRSNKRGDDATRFILNEQNTLAAFQSMIFKFESGDDLDNPSGGDDDSLYGDSDSSVGDAGDNSTIVDDQTHVFWPRTAVTPRSFTASQVRYPSFKEELIKFLRKNDAVVNLDDDPRVALVNSIRISYPSWSETEVIGDGNRRRCPEIALPEGRSRISRRLNANNLKYGRHDPVLLKSVEKRPPRHRAHSMTDRKVARLLVLFKCQSRYGNALQLAFVNIFAISGYPQDDHCHGLFLLKRTSRFQVIPVTTIEREVHLIPRFGNEIGAALRINKKLERKLSDNRALAEKCGKNIGVNEGLSLNKSDLIMDHYEQFWLNSWLDPHIYKNIH